MSLFVIFLSFFVFKVSVTVDHSVVHAWSNFINCDTVRTVIVSSFRYSSIVLHLILALSYAAHSNFLPRVMLTVDEFGKLEACCGNCTDGTGNCATVSVEIDPETTGDDEQESYEAAAARVHICCIAMSAALR